MIGTYGRRMIELGWERLRGQPRAATPDPRVSAITLRSKALGIPKRCYVYRPPVRRAARLPVLYLFRGHEDEWVNPAQDASRQGRTVIDVYEDLLAEGMVGPMVLVFPGISSDDNSVPGLLVNFQAAATNTKPGIGSGRFEEFFLSELAPHVERRWGGDGRRRAVDGFSLGGFMAVGIAARFPQLFRSAGAYDGLYFWDDAEAWNIAAHDATFLNPLFDPAFGAERDRAYAARHNPIHLIRNGDPSALGRVQWLIEYGPRQGEPGDANFYRGARLDEVLRERGLRNRGRGELHDGTHTWRCADEHIRYALPLHWRALNDHASR